MPEVRLPVERRITMTAADKPPYNIPSMDEIRATTPNGLTVLSTFSGCGGSCLGFRMAGFRVLAACEFIEAARDTYSANFPEVPICGNDIRDVSGADLLSLAGVSAVDVLEGSPPCASFSTAGKGHKGWGEVRSYSETKQRTDDLFFEFARILGEVRPRAFVAENVSGLVKGAAKGYFLEILARLKACGYRVRCKVLDAQWLGVPQSRQRTIFVGIRDDLGAEPAHPKPLPYRYSIRDALPWVVRSVQDPRGKFDVQVNDAGEPCFTIKAGGSSHVTVEAETDIGRFAIGREYDKLKPGEQSGKYFNLIKADEGKPSPCILAGHGSGGVASVVHPTKKRKFTIAELRRICGFPDDFVLTGSYRQQWERLGRAVPPPMMRAVAETLKETLSCAG